MRLLSLVLAGLAGLGLAALPKIASGDPPSSGSFTASDDFWTAGGGGTTVNIAPGGTVMFSYPTGSTAHNADFTGGSMPSSCTQTTGNNTGAVPPLPHDPAVMGWSGSCTFNTPGTYTFHCDEHPFMTGTINVGSGTTTTSTTTTTAPSPTTTTSTTPSPGPTSPNPPPVGPTSSPLVGSASQAIHVLGTQHGSVVRGTLKVSAAGVDGSLRATLISGGVMVGSSHSTLHAGTFKFSVKLNRAAARTLARRGKLSLTVKLVVRSTGGRQVTARRTVKLLR